MNAIAKNPHVPRVCSSSDATRLPVGTPSIPVKTAMALALVATLASLGMAVYTGWQCGGLLVERIIRMVLVGVAVLFVHLLPMGWSALHGAARVAVFALWIVATSVVLYGQVGFFMISQQHAGDLRAASVPPHSVSTTTSLPNGRSRTEIAKEVAKVSTDLVRAQAAQCIGDCPTLKVRRARLAAEIVALHAEADEAQRREASEDRHNVQADRIDELRAMLRVDPVAFQVASWLGVSEHRLEMLIGMAYAVVLEGAAIVGWLLVSVASRRAAVVSGWEPVRSDRAGSRETVISGHKVTVPESDADMLDRLVDVGDDSGSLATSEDELGLRKIHEAVLTGKIKPTQKAIRMLLRCGQRKAGSLSRQFRARFGSMCRQGGDLRAPGVMKPALADP